MLRLHLDARHIRAVPRQALRLYVRKHLPEARFRIPEVVGNVRSAGLTVSTHTTGEPAHPTPGIELSAFHIIQGALSNVMRHAPGAEVRVEVDHRPSAVTIRVANTAPNRPDRLSVRPPKEDTK
ncbi:hypothetical protein P6B95_08020 [Streptomyces atratus]|uniref:hypothetical protein n=1 Tax=Streptomyces atratus TaxID=1893 RepID=UPI00167066E4|nr:hypothetical protein [Streptomyces atratus]WPW27332.1 hypothetical protein P6B95_08020 [Streptomyces atratus]GGT58283.1 hypothetical protein GCM10010207_67630 [Streptomyces atratus]